MSGLSATRRFPGFAQSASRRWIRGECCHFALALYDALVKAKEAPEFVGLGGDERFTGHVAIRCDGALLDIRGAMTEADFRLGLQDANEPLLTLTLDQVATQAGYGGCKPPFRGSEMSAARKAVASYRQWMLS